MHDRCLIRLQSYPDSSGQKPRILPEGTRVEIKRGSWPVLPIFKLMQGLGSIDESEMFRTFNMGIGMVLICAAEDVPAIQSAANSCYEIGRVLSGPKTVSLT